MKTILGVDIGMSGALAFYDGTELLIWDMPVFEFKGGREVDIHRVCQIIKDQKPDCAYVEDIIMPFNSGRKPMMSLSECTGYFKGVLASLEIPFNMVKPNTWKKSIGCPKDKNEARLFASRLLPLHKDNWHLKKHDGRAEAALIALYGFNK